MSMDRNWKRVAAGKVSRMTAAAALEKLEAIRARVGTIDQPIIRELTGGFNSQSINFSVIRLLGRRAGIIKGK